MIYKLLFLTLIVTILGYVIYIYNKSYHEYFLVSNCYESHDLNTLDNMNYLERGDNKSFSQDTVASNSNLENFDSKQIILSENDLYQLNSISGIPKDKKIFSYTGRDLNNLDMTEYTDTYNFYKDGNNFAKSIFSRPDSNNITSNCIPGISSEYCGISTPEEQQESDILTSENILSKSISITNAENSLKDFIKKSNYGYTNKKASDENLLTNILDEDISLDESSNSHTSDDETLDDETLDDESLDASSDDDSSNNDSSDASSDINNINSNKNSNSNTNTSDSGKQPINSRRNNNQNATNNSISNIACVSTSNILDENQEDIVKFSVCSRDSPKSNIKDDAISSEEIQNAYNSSRVMSINTNLMKNMGHSGKCGKCYKLSCVKDASEWDYNKQGQCKGTPITLRVVDNIGNNNILYGKYPNLFSIDPLHYSMLSGTDKTDGYLPVTYKEVPCPF